MARGDVDPPALLAQLAACLHRWELRGELEPDWIDRAEPLLEQAASRCPVGGPGMDFLVGRARKALRACSRKPDFDRFVAVVEAMQRLDEWHQPLALAAGGATKLDDAHDRALRRLQVDGTGYNAPAGDGAIIPAAAIDATRPARSGTVGQLLHFTAYVPPILAAGDRDDASAPSKRTVELRYVGAPSRSGDPRGAVGERPLVAVAPVLQDRADAEVEHRGGPDRYGVRVLYDPSRLDAIVADAMSAGAHLLFMPEMAIDADRVPLLASAIRRMSAAHRKLTGDLPELRFVVAGVAHSSGGTGNNSIVVMNVEGGLVLEQEKLCRWNLKWWHQRNYGVVPACAAGAPDLAEDIPGGDRVWIADLEHLGRFLTLICADMDHDKPGDWLVANVSLDWLHAPIMDKSIGWSVDGGGELQPWIVRRAERAAQNGVPKVVVTNSVLLTLRLNDHNQAHPHPDHPVLDRCAISFMLDRTGDETTFRQLEASIPCPTPIVEVVKWLEGFGPFPPA